LEIIPFSILQTQLRGSLTHFYNLCALPVVVVVVVVAKQLQLQLQLQLAGHKNNSSIPKNIILALRVASLGLLKQGT